jgi:hypothetical protein
MRQVLEVAAEFDAEDGLLPRTAGPMQPGSRGDRVRRAILVGLVGLVGEDGIAAAVA